MTLSTRPFGATGRTVTAMGFGAWAIGGSWGEVTEAQAMDTLHAALDAGVTFIDTADVYGDGRSERLIRAVLAERPGPAPMVATKAGRRLNPHLAEGYTLDNLGAFVDRSRANLGCDRLDLLQLHCPPSAVYDRPEVFAALDTLVDQGRIAQYGVSVETVDEALRALARPGVASVQIIYNLFRQRPAEVFFPQARARGVAVIVRVPLASGMLTGKMRADTVFAEDDHRAYNRDGAFFDKGETFSGVPYDVALAAVEELRPLVPEGATLAQMALRWCLTDPAVSVVIPGGRSPEQARANAAADALAPLSPATLAAARAVYDRLVAPHVRQLW